MPLDSPTINSTSQGHLNEFPLDSSIEILCLVIHMSSGIEDMNKIRVKCALHLNKLLQPLLLQNLRKLKLVT